jgi:hypothetical protein
MTVQQDLQQLADYFADAKLHDFEQIVLKASKLIQELESSRDRVVQSSSEEEHS